MVVVIAERHCSSMVFHGDLIETFCSLRCNSGARARERERESEERQYKVTQHPHHHIPTPSSLTVNASMNCESNTLHHHIPTPSSLTFSASMNCEKGAPTLVPGVPGAAPPFEARGRRMASSPDATTAPCRGSKASSWALMPCAHAVSSALLRGPIRGGERVVWSSGW